MHTPGILGRLRPWLEMVVTLALLTAILMALWAFGRARLTAAVYAQRLEALGADYERLRQDYNRAVSRTAVTELRVSEDAVTVVIRTADGVTREFPTACRPDQEVYADYVVLDGRLWIRRVFDAATAPAAGTLIDPALAGVPWEADEATVGKAVYRKLTEGRWLVTVTGNGSLGLERARREAVVQLSPTPPVADFEAVRRDLERAQTDVSWWALLMAALRPTATSP
jgi:hypothetical protein